MAKKKFNLFELFNPTKDGKGVKKTSYGDGWGKRDAKTFFKMYIENLSRLFSVNIYMVLGNFPLLIGLFAMGGYLNKHTTAPSSQLFGPVYGVFNINPGNPAISALMGVHGIQTELSVNTTATLILFGLSGLALFTWGYVSVGTTYILRNIVKGEPIFMWDDFWYAIKRNLFQGMVVGILDVLFMGLLTYDVVFFYYNIGPFLNNVMFYFSILLAFIYFLMRFYIYILMITFNLKIRHIYKNAFIFSILNIKRNALAILGIIALLAINYALFIMYLPIGIILPFIITLSTGAFIAAYAAYPKIKEIMIDPYIDEKEPETEEEPIFRDMG